MKEITKKDDANKTKDPLRDILDNYKNNIAGKQMTPAEGAKAWANTIFAFAKEINKMEDK